MEPSIITLVVLANLLFLGVLIWKSVWLLRKIREYPSSRNKAAGDAGSVRDQDEGPDSSGSEGDTHE